nr:anti-sigma factor [Cohnella zeiphila]
MLGEGTEVERKRFERHLEECPSCRADAAVWEETWGELHEDVEWAEPPADLKLQVMDALDAADGESREPAAAFKQAEAGGAEPEARPLAVRRLGKPSPMQAEAAVRPPAKPRLRTWGLAAIALVLVFGAGWWSGSSFRSRGTDSVAALPPADRIDSLFHLVADPSNGMMSEYPQAYGVACVVSTSPDKPRQLIVYLFGAPRTDGDEAYQVWLWNDGVRRSAGALKVENSGIGILTTTLADDAPPIQTIGVTLEPAGPSAAPKGPKVFGSAPDDPAWDV